MKKLNKEKIFESSGKRQISNEIMVAFEKVQTLERDLTPFRYQME